MLSNVFYIYICYIIDQSKTRIQYHTGTRERTIIHHQIIQGSTKMRIPTQLEELIYQIQLPVLLTMMIKRITIWFIVLVLLDQWMEAF